MSSQGALAQRRAAPGQPRAGDGGEVFGRAAGFGRRRLQRVEGGEGVGLLRGRSSGSVGWEEGEEGGFGSCLSIVDKLDGPLCCHT